MESFNHNGYEYRVCEVMSSFFASEGVWRQYYHGQHGIIFVVDSTAPSGWSDYDGSPRVHPRADTSWEGLDLLLKDTEVKGLPILIFANKQDLPNAMGRNDIIENLKLYKWPWATWKVQPCSAITGAGLQEGLDWLSNATKGVGERHKSGMRVKCDWLLEEVYLRAFLSDILGLHSDVANGWLSQRVDFEGAEEARAWSEQQNRIAMKIPLVGSQKDFRNSCKLMLKYLKRKDTPDKIFLASLEDSSFMAQHKFDRNTGRKFRFDHYYQLRLIWLYFRKYNSRREALKQIFKVFEQLQGESYNLTFTCFWSHMVHYSINSQITQIDDFKTFLTINPCMTDSKLYLQYYDEGIAESDEAKKEMILPKKKVLPSIMMSTQGDGERAKKAMSDFEAKECSDLEFIKAFESDELSGWGHEYFIRVIFCYLNTLPRKAALEKCFSEFARVQGKGIQNMLFDFFGKKIYFSTLACARARPRI